MPSEQQTLSCASEIITERNRYYTGKYMTARDFAAEQHYHLSRHRLHNRLLHGSGVVCGLGVKEHPTLACVDTHVRVRAGIAIDCFGNEIFVEHDQAVELPIFSNGGEDGSSDQPPHQEIKIAKADQLKDVELDGAKLMILRHIEKPIEYVPVLFNEGGCDANHQEANRIHEGFEFDFVEWGAVDPSCWQLPNGRPNVDCHKDCDDDITGPAGICFEPDCSCAGGVPVALLTTKVENGKTTVLVHNAGRPQLATNPDLLTKIVHINWPHNGEISIDDIRDPEKLAETLKITFDRSLHKSEHGVNEFTFEIQYRGLDKDYEVLTGEVTVEDERRVAAFKIDPQFLGLGSRPRESLVGNTLMIRLRCDFVMDCLSNPIDGNHLRGILPSGNGTPGGTFTSWLSVVAGTNSSG